MEGIATQVWSKGIQTTRTSASESSQIAGNYNYLERFNNSTMAIKAFLQDEKTTTESTMRQIEDFFHSDLLEMQIAVWSQNGWE